MISSIHSSVLGLDFHDGLLQLVEVCPKGKQLELLAFNRLEIPDGVIVDGRIKDEEQLKLVMQRLFQSANPRPVETNRIVLVLPSKHVFTHIFRFPASFSLKDIRKAIVFEVETVIPFAVEDMFWDCHVLQDGDSKMKSDSQGVFFSGVPKAVAEEYVHFFESIGIRPHLFATHADALTCALAGDFSNENSLVIEFDPYASNYLIVKGKILHYFLSVAEGSQWMESGLKKPEDPVFQSRLTAFIHERAVQAQKIIEEQEADEHLGTIDQIFLTGEYAHIAPFYEELKAYFPQKKVLVGDPKHQLTVDNRRFWEQYQKRGGQIPYSVFFVDALGVAYQYLFRRPGSNLLPDDLKKSFFFEKLQLFMMIGSVTMAIFSLIFASYLFVFYGRLTQERNELATDIKRVENTLYGTRYQEIKSQLTQFNNEINQLSDIDRALFSVPELLNQVTMALPAGVRLTGYVYDDLSLQVRITGVADDREDLLELQQNLKKLAFVKEVLAPLSNYDEKQNVSFLVNLQLSFSELPYHGNANPS